MSLRTLVQWELSQYWKYPWLEFLLFSNVSIFLQRPVDSIFDAPRDIILFIFSGFPFLTLFQILLVSFVASRTVAHAFENRELVVLFSQPVSRRAIFLSKFSAGFLVLLIPNIAGLAITSVVLPASPFDMVFAAALLGLFLRMLFLYAIAMSFCLMLKTQVSSFLLTFLVPAVIEFGLASQSGSLHYFTVTGNFGLLFSYLTAPAGQIIIGGPTGNDVIFSVALPAVISLILLAAGYIYFVRFLQVD